MWATLAAVSGFSRGVLLVLLASFQGVDRAGASPRVVDTRLGQQDATVYWPDSATDGPWYDGGEVITADLDGDGIDDLVFGHSDVGNCPTLPCPELHQEVHIHYGPIPSGELDLETSADDVVIRTSSTGQRFGAVLAAVLWQGALWGFSWYLRGLASFTVHGSIGAVVAFLVWVYLSAVILLYGVEVTASYAKVRRQMAAESRQRSVNAESPGV